MDCIMYYDDDDALFLHMYVLCMLCIMYVCIIIDCIIHCSSVYGNLGEVD